MAAAFARGAAKRPELAQPRLLDLHAGISNDEMQKVAHTRFFLFARFNTAYCAPACGYSRVPPSILNRPTYRVFKRFKR